MTVSNGNHKLIEDADMSASFQSDTINLHGKRSFSMDAVFTGSPNGTSFIGVSDDNVDYRLLPDSSIAVTAAGNIFYNVDSANYSYVKYFYTFASGSGTCNVSFKTKGDN